MTISGILDRTMERLEIYEDEAGEKHEKPTEVKAKRRISAYVFVEREGALLLVKTRSALGFQGWEVPGGGVEIGEMIGEGAVREVYEESGYRVTIEPQPFFVEERNYFSKAAQKFYKAVLFFYRGTLVSEVQDAHVINTVEKDEIDEVRWIPCGEINESILHPMCRRALQQKSTR